MYRSLALETSGSVGSIALVDGTTVLAEEQFPHGLKHAAGIVPMIDRLCRAHGWRPADIHEVFVSVGPGSFTGLRVGVTVAKALAFATGALVVDVPMTEVLARNAPEGWQNVVVVLDAKRDQVFTATFSSCNGHPVVEEPARLDTLAAALSRARRPVHLIGEGIPYHRKFIPPDDPDVIVTPPESWRARASVVAEIGLELSGESKGVDAFCLRPIYVRKPEAEEKYDAARAGGAAGPSHP